MEEFWEEELILKYGTHGKGAVCCHRMNLLWWMSWPKKKLLSKFRKVCWERREVGVGNSKVMRFSTSERHKHLDWKWMEKKLRKWKSSSIWYKLLWEWRDGSRGKPQVKWRKVWVTCVEVAMLIHLYCQIWLQKGKHRSWRGDQNRRIK